MEQAISFKKDNINYWSKRAAGYSNVNREELSGNQHDVWQQVLHSNIVKQFGDRDPRTIKILDVGTGPGFFAIILAELGYDVTAVDYTAAMLQEAKANAGMLAERITFREMNAQDLLFEDNTFDVVVSRNVTWNLHEPCVAYEHWTRVIKKNGILLNFDANWYSYLEDASALKAHLEDRRNVSASSDVRDENEGTDVDAMEAIARQTYLVSTSRPAWDICILRELGMNPCADTDIWKTVWTKEERINNSSTPMFMIKAIKE